MIDKFPDLDISVGTIWKVKLYLFQSIQLFFLDSKESAEIQF